MKRTIFSADTTNTTTTASNNNRERERDLKQFTERFVKSKYLASAVGRQFEKEKPIKVFLASGYGEKRHALFFSFFLRSTPQPPPSTLTLAHTH